MPLPLIAAIGLGVSAAGSIGQMISGASRASKAKKALENYQRQELRNVTEGLRVSTLGAEMQTEEAQRRFATTVEALQSGGVRGLVGGLGAAEQAQQQLQQNISADLDRQQQQIETMKAEDESRIRQMTEARQTSEIAGLGQEVAAGRQLVNSGISGLAQTGMAAFTMGLGSGAGMKQGLKSGLAAGKDALSAINSFDTSGTANLWSNTMNNANSFATKDFSNLGFGNVPNTFTKTFSPKPTN